MLDKLNQLINLRNHLSSFVNGYNCPRDKQNIVNGIIKKIDEMILNMSIELNLEDIFKEVSSDALKAVVKGKKNASKQFDPA